MIKMEILYNINIKIMTLYYNKHMINLVIQQIKNFMIYKEI